MNPITCSQCGHSLRGGRSKFLGAPVCYKCEVALDAIDRVLKAVTAKGLCRSFSKLLVPQDRIIQLLDLETAKFYHDEAIRRALKWGKEHLPKGEEPERPNELVWMEEVWGLPADS